MDENLEQCIETDSATLNQQLETITGSLTELTDGLAIRINNEVDESAKTDLLKSICNLIDVNIILHLFEKELTKFCNWVVGCNS